MQCQATPLFVGSVSGWRLGRSTQRRKVRGQRLDLGVVEAGKERVRFRGGSVRPGAASH